MEALDSHSDLVLGSVFSCLSKFTNCAAFFDSSHAIYGVEPLVAALAKAVKFQNPDVFRSGLQLMAQIFVKQPKNVPLFTNEGLFCAYTVVLQEALSSMDHRVLRQAVNTLDVTLLHNHLPRHATSDMNQVSSGSRDAPTQEISQTHFSLQEHKVRFVWYSVVAKSDLS